MSSLSRDAFENMKKKHQEAKEAREVANAASVNEQITRHRVEAIEFLLRRGFLGRLRWLIMGR